MQYNDRLKKLRKERKMTQEEAGAIIGVKKQQYMRYEKGQNEMKPYHIIQYAIFYKCTTDYIFGLSQDPKKGRFDA